MVPKPEIFTIGLSRPGKVAVVESVSGQVLTYEDLAHDSLMLSNAMAAALSSDARVAVMMANSAAMVTVLWAAQRSGRYYTAIPSQLSPDEAAFMLNDSEASILLVDEKCSYIAEEIVGTTPNVALRIGVTWTSANFLALDEFVARFAQQGISSELDGMPLLYSSGTSGRPKGIQRELLGGHVGSWRPMAPFENMGIGFDEMSVFLGTGPLYHAAPLNFSMSVHRTGGTLVLMDRFDALTVLELVDKYKVTHAQFVPTMLRRIVELPDTTKKFNLSSLRVIFHAAAPCPEETKRRCIELFGPILWEHYGSTEGIGITLISSEEWLERPASVGRSISGPIHVLDDLGCELPAGVEGVIYFDGSEYVSRTAYVGRASDGRNLYDDRNWATVGDIGWVDEEGYLYLTDRQSGVIISGGVNIYPREVERVLMNHSLVKDVAVVGYPDEDLGQVVVAVAELEIGDHSLGESESQLKEFCLKNLARQKIPQRIFFLPTLPRGETGKVLSGRLQSLVPELMKSFSNP